MLADDRGLKIATIDNIHTVLHQVLKLAVEDNYVRSNISDNLLKELKQTHHFEDDHKKALTVPEQELFLDFLASEKSNTIIDIRFLQSCWEPEYVSAKSAACVGRI